MHRYVAMIPVVSNFFLKNNEEKDNNNNKNTMEVTNDVTHPKKNENERLSFSKPLSYKNVHSSNWKL
jgi:hypothetical protein